ncbi:hypothetical protein GE061_005302 [Apolygus lucorum]|uniref:Cation/H+ exchanger transmembrane domain-containing protein n=1 Tax=Apolygus lucorum TaxID=248454 RepID=A0A6A4INV0_APOLU|nr:hypothetical protein GE061_005302 [Apolygus lucorum]
MEFAKTLDSNVTGFSINQFTLFEYLVNIQQDNDEVIVIMQVSILVMTIACCLTPSWYFLPRLSFLFVFFLSWIVGMCVKSYGQNYDLGSEMPSLAVNALSIITPILVFHCTLNIDYHTLGRVLGPVLLISVCLFTVNAGLLSIVMFSIGELDRSYHSKLVHALNLSILSCDYSVMMLEKAQTQVRQLQILLQGEMLISIALYVYVEGIVLKYSNINHTGANFILGSTVFYALWSLVGILFGMLASYLFRQFVNYSYNDGIGQTACCLAFNVILYVFCSIFGTTGTLAVLAFGICLGASKIKFNNKTATFYQNTHDFENYFGSLVVFSYCGLWIGLTPDKFTYFDTSYVFIVFCTSIITRMITFVIIHRTVSKINLQVNWKHLTIAVQSPARGALVLAYSLMYIVNDKFAFGKMILVDNVILVCLSYIVNLALMGPTLGMIGMYDLTRAKIVNMNLAVSQVNECRSRAIQALKVDRVIADANWIVVEESTILQHPYKKNTHTPMEEEDEDFESKGQTRIVYCGECGAKGTAPLSKQEMEDVALDIKHRILKAQRVSFYRQHDNGTLSRHGVKVLSNLVEKVLVRDDPVLTAKDLKIQREGTARMQCLKKVFRHLFTVTSKKHAFIPTFWIRAFCFRFCTSRKYQIIMACLSMIDLVFLLRLLHLHYGEYRIPGEAKVLQILDIFFFSLFFLEFIVEVLGIGVVQYFYSPVNQVEFSCSCIIRTIELGMFLNICQESDKFEDVLQADEIIFLLKTILILRCTRVYIFIVALIPKILNLVDKKMDEDLIKSYDIGKAYLITQEQVMKFLGHLVTNDEVFNSVSKVLDSDRLIVAKELGLITFDRTTIATTNKTAHAIRNVVNSMTDCINSMKEEEYLDPLETTVLVGALEKVKNRARSLNLIEPLEPHLILTEIPWLKNDTSTLNFFLKHARVSSYCQDELIINSGDDPCGLLIIIEGLAKVTYVPTVVSNDLNAKYGVLPNYDFFINLRFQLPQEEYITTNAVIGEIGIVTGRKYNMRVVCETSVHLMWFPMKILRAVIHDAGNHVVFQAALWKSIGIKIAVNLLQDCSQFRGWSREKLFMYLQGGVVPVLTGVSSIYIGEYVSDVILIEGIAMDHATRLLFVAPYYIPRTVATLLLPGSPMLDRKTNYPTRLFVVPNFHSDADDVSGSEGLFKEYLLALERESAEKESIARSSSRTLGNKDAAECKKGHGRSKMSAYTRKVLKAQKKTLKAIRFMEYIPTVSGPIERNLTSTTFLMAEKRRLITQSIYAKTKYYDPSFGYVGDVAENSEIREMKGEEDEEDARRGNRRSLGGQKRSTSRTLSSIGSISSSRMSMGIDTEGSLGGKTHVEIHLIESSEDEIEKYESKEVQTSVRMVFKRKITPSKISVHSFSDAP